jgi:hypothetical protein
LEHDPQGAEISRLRMQTKKEPPVAALGVDREASNRVDGAHSMHPVIPGKD